MFVIMIIFFIFSVCFVLYIYYNICLSVADYVVRIDLLCVAGAVLRSIHQYLLLSEAGRRVECPTCVGACVG